MFWGDKRDVVVASAEFKDPGMNLDAPQTDRKEKISAVAQAFRTAAGFQGCLWILVSNFRELRLYHAQRSEEPLVSLDLHEIRTPRQLAVLCAHFDFDALVGNRGTSEMSTMLNSKHPSAPISASDGTLRIIGTFTPQIQKPFDFRLCDLYDVVNATAQQLFRLMRMPWSPPSVPTEIEDGWCMVETESWRFAVSTEGQVRWSSRRRDRDRNIFHGTALDIYAFLRAVEYLFRTLCPTHALVHGIVNFELREAEGWRVYFDSDDLAKSNEMNMDFALRSACGRPLPQISCSFPFATHLVPLAAQMGRSNSS
jgi:hypothetical protein